MATALVPEAAAPIAILGGVAGAGLVAFVLTERQAA
jgi:hypothetical protein